MAPRRAASHVASHAGHVHAHPGRAARAPVDPKAPRDPLREALAGLGPSHHLCLIYETREEQFAAAVPYIAHGLERGDKCVYIADDNTASAVVAAMREQGVDAEAAMAAGDLTVATKRETYLKQGVFDPDWMIRFLGDSAREAEEQGYASLRVTGEMTWALGQSTGADRLMEYEAKLNEFFPTSNSSAICQYNRGRFSPQVIEDVIYTHPRVIHGGLVCENFYYVPPEEFLKPHQQHLQVDRILANILARERVENELRRLNRELEERVGARTAELARANRELESFSYSVSHDLRAPLRGIEMLSVALEEDYADRVDEEGRRHLARLRAEAQRVSRLVSDLLDLSRLTTGELRREDVDLSTLAQLALAELRSAEPSRDVATTVQPGLRANADPRLLRVALENLLGNAWKYTARAPRAVIEVGEARVDGERAFYVRDNGAGFDMAKAGRLFTPFQRLHGAKEFEGTGIGLATVQRVVHRHGGRVWAEGEPGKGATFWFTL